MNAGFDILQKLLYRAEGGVMALERGHGGKDCYSTHHGYESGVLKGDSSQSSHFSF